MGVFTRLSDIISSNVNALLDKAEDPEKMIAQVVREMEEGLANAKRYAATAIAGERRLGRELDQNRAQAAFWEGKARTAVAQGRDDLARRMLARKKEHADLVQCLAAQHGEAVQTSGNVRAAVRGLEARLAEARRKQRSLLARHRAARVRVELNRVGGGAVDFHSSQAKFERLEDQLVQFEDELAAQAELNHALGGLEAEVADLEREQAIEADLAALKRESQDK
jgi:phage shock protein A